MAKELFQKPQPTGKNLGQNL